MDDQNSDPSEGLNTDFVVDLITGYWNLAAVLAEQAKLSGVSDQQIADAVKSLAQKNRLSMTRVAGEAVNDGIWRLLDIYDPSQT